MNKPFNLSEEEYNHTAAFISAVENFNQLVFSKYYSILNSEELLIGSETIQNKTPYIHVQKVENITGYTFDSPIESEITISVRNILSPYKQPRYFGFRIENSTFNGFQTYISNDPLGTEGDKKFEQILKENLASNSSEFEFLKELISSK